MQLNNQDSAVNSKPTQWVAYFGEFFRIIYFISLLFFLILYIALDLPRTLIVYENGTVAVKWPYPFCVNISVIGNSFPSEYHSASEPITFKLTHNLNRFLSSSETQMMCTFPSKVIHL